MAYRLVVIIQTTSTAYRLFLIISKSENIQLKIFKILAAILHLGNLTFQFDEENYAILAENDGNYEKITMTMRFFVIKWPNDDHNHKQTLEKIYVEFTNGHS